LLHRNNSFAVQRYSVYRIDLKKYWFRLLGYPVMTSMPFFGQSSAMPFGVWPGAAQGLAAYTQATQAAWVMSMKLWSPWMTSGNAWQQPSMMPWSMFANPWFAAPALSHLSASPFGSSPFAPWQNAVASFWTAALTANPWAMMASSAAPAMIPTAFRSAGGFAMAPGLSVSPAQSSATTFDALLRPWEMWSFAWKPFWPAAR
jgi:hypothetical protein